MSDGPSMECPLCKRPAHCSYHQGLTQTIKCDGCGFNHTHGMLGSPPEQQRDISLLTNSMPTVSQKDITDWCGYDVKKAAIAARSTVSLEPWLETKHAINAALHNKGDAFTRKDEEVADINLSVSAPSPISPCEISVVESDYKSGYAAGYNDGYKDGVSPVCSLATGEEITKPVAVSLAQMCDAYRWNNNTIEKGVKAVLDAAGISYAP